MLKRNDQQVPEPGKTVIIIIWFSVLMNSHQHCLDRIGLFLGHNKTSTCLVTRHII